MSDAIDAAAWAIFDEHCARLGLRNMPWHQQDDAHRDEFMAYARAAIAAYRDSEIEALRAKLAEFETALDSWMVVNWIGVYEKERGISDTVALCLERALDVERDELKAKLADCQSVIRHKGHDEDCPARLCDECGHLSGYAQHRPSYSIYADEHPFQPGPCSDACGHDRTTGEKA